MHIAHDNSTLVGWYNQTTNNQPDVGTMERLLSQPAFKQYLEEDNIWRKKCLEEHNVVKFKIFSPGTTGRQIGSRDLS